MYGSWGFARGQQKLIRDAININMETVGSGRLGIIEKEKMYMNPYSPEAIELIGRAGKRAGIDLPKDRHHLRRHRFLLDHQGRGKVGLPLRHG